ncbi:MAG: bifunctional diaminohydroxyphosphoribosylaminopyrimidine deaminase/5-amino-6-(5-phosphoribosylamino)uracil reductase RibD, partial [candidate division WOR-3 bacterium]
QAYDEMFMQYALSLAEKGWGNTEINPLVGAVVAKNNRIIGQGFHRKLGEAHAEVCALTEAGDQAHGATLYVNLEPCCCAGRTPPCVEAILRAQIKRVVIGIIDPNPEVNGNGIQFLKKHNIDVTSDVLADQAQQLNKWYEKYITKKIPYIIVKIALSKDKKISGFQGKYITSEQSQRFVHSLRSRVSAVLIGINTLLEDNPYLTDRLVGRHNPTRIVIDPHLKISLESHFLRRDSRRVIITHRNSDSKKISELESLGAEFIFLEGRYYLLSVLMRKLGTLNIASILVEGGGKIFSQFLGENLYDELYLVIAQKKVNKGKKFDIDDTLLKDVTPDKIGEDLLYHVYRHH